MAFRLPLLGSEVDMDKPSLLFLGGGNCGTMNDGDTGSEEACDPGPKELAPGAVPRLRRPGNVPTRPVESVEANESVPFTIDPVVVGRVLIPLVFIDKFLRFRGRLLDPSEASDVFLGEESEDRGISMLCRS